MITISSKYIYYIRVLLLTVNKSKKRKRRRYHITIANRNSSLVKNAKWFLMAAQHGKTFSKHLSKF